MVLIVRWQMVLVIRHIEVRRDLQLFKVAQVGNAQRPLLRLAQRGQQQRDKA